MEKNIRKKTYKKFDFDTLDGKIYDESDCEFPINFQQIKSKINNIDDKIALIKFKYKDDNQQLLNSIKNLLKKN